MLIFRSTLQGQLQSVKSYLVVRSHCYLGSDFGTRHPQLADPSGRTGEKFLQWSDTASDYEDILDNVTLFAQGFDS